MGNAVEMELDFTRNIATILCYQFRAKSSFVLPNLVVSPIVVKTIPAKVVPIASTAAAAAIVVEPLMSSVTTTSLVIALISSSPSSLIVVITPASTPIVLIPAAILPISRVIIVPDLVGKRIRQHDPRAGSVPRNLAHHLLLVLVDPTAQLFKHAQVAST